MHEHVLARSLVRQVLRVAAEQRAERVSRVAVRLGALSHSDPEALRAHFELEARATIAAGAVLDVAVTEELLELALESIEIERLERGDAGALSS